MAGVSLEKRFAGQARLVRLLLWRTGDSTDLNACFEAARAAGMISADDEAFLRDCLDAEERQRSGEPLPFTVDQNTITRLQRCADKLNRADSA